MARTFLFWGVLVCSVSSTAPSGRDHEPNGVAPTGRVTPPESMKETGQESSDAQREETLPLPEPSSFADQANLTSSSAVGRAFQSAGSRQAAVSQVKAQLFSGLRKAQKGYASAKRKMSGLKKASVDLQNEMRAYAAQKQGKAQAASRAKAEYATQDTGMSMKEEKAGAAEDLSPELDAHLSSPPLQYQAGLSGDAERVLRWRENRLVAETHDTQTAMASAAADIASLESQVNELFGLMRTAEDDSSQTGDEADPLMEMLSKMERKRSEAGRGPATDLVDMTVPDFGQNYIASRYNGQQPIAEAAAESSLVHKHEMERGHRNTSANKSSNTSMMNLTSYAPYDADTMPELATSFAVLSMFAGQNATRMAALQARERELTIELTDAERERSVVTEELSVIKVEAQSWLSLLETSAAVGTLSGREAEARRAGADAQVRTEKKQDAEAAVSKVGAAADLAALQGGGQEANVATMLAKVAITSTAGAATGREGAGGLLAAASQMKAKQMMAMELMRQSVELAQAKEDAAVELTDDLQVLNVELPDTGTGLSDVRPEDLVQLPRSSSLSDLQEAVKETRMEAHWKKTAKIDPSTGHAREHVADALGQPDDVASSLVAKAPALEHVSEQEQCKQLRAQAQAGTESGVAAGEHPPAAVDGAQLTAQAHQALLIKCALAVSKNMRAAHYQYVAVAKQVAQLETQVGDLFSLVPQHIT